MYIQNKKGRKVKVSTKASASLSVTSDPCDYQLGDTGPGGGTIVSIPGVGANTGNFYYELLHAVSQTASINNTGSSPAHSTWTWHNGAGSGEFFNCNNSLYSDFDIFTLSIIIIKDILLYINFSTRL